MEIKLRRACPEDAADLLAIYSPYVKDTAISFETVIPSEQEFRSRIETTLRRYPYIVAFADGQAAGYAYAGPFAHRAAYDWSVETSIYLKQSMKKCGIGRKLHQALEDSLKAQGFLNMCACISVTDHDDPYLTNNSFEFHSHLGYRLVGRFLQSGYKFERWYDMVWMEKSLGDHPKIAAPIIPFSELNIEF